MTEGRGGLVDLSNPNQVVTNHNSPSSKSCPNSPICKRLFFQHGVGDRTLPSFSILLLCFFPGLISHVRNAYNELGVTVSTATTLPDGSRSGFTVNPPTLSVPDSLVLLGKAVLVLLKRHFHFLEHHINALMVNAGVPSTKYAYERTFYRNAMTIKNILGCSFGLKKALLEYIIDASAGTRRSSLVCSYLCDAVAWSGMEAIVFIYHTLWNPISYYATFSYDTPGFVFL